MKKARRASKSKAASSRTPAKPSSKLKTPRKKLARPEIFRKLAAPPPSVAEPVSVLQKNKPARPEIKNLPFSYNQTKLILMARDPYWAYTYWDFSADTWNWIVTLRERDHGARPKLRIHNVEAGTFEDKDVFLDAKNWYLELGMPDTAFEVELGILDSQGKFHSIARSNRIRTPRNGPSNEIDEQWNLSEKEFAEIYRLSGGGKTGHGSEIFSSLKRR